MTMNHEISGSYIAGSEPAETTQSTAEARTARGARDTATRYIERITQPNNDDAGGQRTNVGYDMSPEEEAGYVDAYSRVHNETIARNMHAADNVALDREVRAFRDRPDIKFFNEQAEREVLVLWRDMFGGRRGGLDQAYRLWHDQKFSDQALRRAAASYASPNAKTKRAALETAARYAAAVRETEDAYRTPREKAFDDVRSRRGAMQRASAYIDAEKKAARVIR